MFKETVQKKKTIKDSKEKGKRRDLWRTHIAKNKKENGRCVGFVN